MKKKLFALLIIAAIAVAAGFTIIQENKDLALSDVLLSNVEALASCETTTGGSCWLNTSSWKC